MATSAKTPYEILGVSKNAREHDLRLSYRMKIHEHLQDKISPADFRLICRAHETLSDRSRRKEYDSLEKWTFHIPIDQYTLQQLAAEPHLIRDLKKRLEKANPREINAQDPVTRHTTLYCAGRAGNVEAVRFLTQHGAESDIFQHSKSTALHVASYYGHANAVRYLLESGADYRIINLGNRTAEQEADGDDVTKVFAEMKRNPYVRVAADELKWFRENDLAQHIDTEYFTQRQTLLHCASRKGYFNMVRLLVEEHLAKMDVVDINGNSPLHLAVYDGHLIIVEYLLNHGCNPTLSNRWGTTAKEAVSLNRQLMADVFESMRERDMFEMARRGVDWWFFYYFDVQSKDAFDFNGVSLLYYACRYGHYSVAKWLLEQGANVNFPVTNESKNTPLHAAKYHGHLGIVELLLEYGADVSIRNGSEATVLDQEISNDVNPHSARQIDELLQPYKRNLKSTKVLDIYVYDDESDHDQPKFKVQLGMDAGYRDLLAALPGTSGKQYSHFSIARRALEFSEEDPSILSAVCRARYVSSKFIETPIHLIRHKTKPKKAENRHSTFPESNPYMQQLSRHGKRTSFSLPAPIIEKKTVNIGNLIFTFAESSVNEDSEFEVTTFFPSDPQKFTLSGCICLFKTEIYSDTSSIVELPTVSFINEPNAHLYTLATPTPYWFTCNTLQNGLPMMNGIHAWVRHIHLPPIPLRIPPDMFISAALEQPLTKRNDPVSCLSLLVRERNREKFPLIAYHGTNMKNIRSILLDALVVPGTVVSSGGRIQPPSDHIARPRSCFGVEDYATAIFVSPSIHYSSDPAFATIFTAGDQQLIPVLECSVKRDSFNAYPGTVSGYTACSSDDMKALDWRITDPTSIEINAILFITTNDSIAAAKKDRITSSN